MWQATCYCTLIPELILKRSAAQQREFFIAGFSRTQRQTPLGLADNGQCWFCALQINWKEARGFFLVVSDKMSTKTIHQSDHCRDYNPSCVQWLTCSLLSSVMNEATDSNAFHLMHGELCIDGSWDRAWTERLCVFPSKLFACKAIVALAAAD